MIRATAFIDTSPIDELIVFLESQNNIVSEVGQEVASQIIPPMIAELKDTPPKPTYPIQWTSERQRRAYFASNGFGKGIPTKRSNKVQSGWDATVIVDGGRVQFTVKNNVPYAKYVYGTLTKDRAIAMRLQQNFHRITGWQVASETVEFWLKAYQDDFKKIYAERIGEFGRVRSKRYASAK